MSSRAVRFKGKCLIRSIARLTYASVYIVPADLQVLPDSQQLYSESQGKKGFFKFVHLPPGRYVVLVNPEDARTPDFPYRRTFHPGVHERSAASVISLRAGEQMKNIDIRLEQQFAARRISVHVTWADGKPVRDFAFIAAKGAADPKLLSRASVTATATAGELKLVPNEPYEVQAELICRYSDPRSVGPGATLESDKVHLSAEDRRSELTLVLPVASCPELPGTALVPSK